MKKMKIARVFPTQTSMSPVDKDAYFGFPDLFTPQYDEIHISVVFTWDISRANKLAESWKSYGEIKIGGPAIDGEPEDGFIPGKYLRQGVVITSRGCPNRCPFCFVKSPLKEINISEGNIILDNNLLACSDRHVDKVFQMLSHQKRIEFSGGLEAGRFNHQIINKLRSISIYQLFLAYDHESRKGDVQKTIEKLKQYFTRNQIRCYVLIGFGNDSIDKAEERLRFIYDLGGLPFAMLYRNKEGEYPQPEKEWRKFQRSWTRPASIKTIMQDIPSPRSADRD